jgi:putative inorganic carbon (HCO3(-)) transporter
MLTGSAPSASWPRVASSTEVPALGRRDSSRLAFGALVALTVVALIAPQAWIPALAEVRPGLALALAGLGAVLNERLRRGQWLVPHEREMYLLIALSAWAFATIPLSYWPGGSVAFLADVALKSVVLFWLIVNTVTTPDRHWRIAWVLVVTVFPAAEAGIENYVRGVYVPGSDRIYGYRAGLTSNPNDLALVLNLILPLAVAVLLGTRRPWARVVVLGAMATMVTGIVLSFSRAGFITLAVITVIYLVKFCREGRWTWASAVVVGALLALALFPASYVQRITTIGDVDSDPTGSAQERWYDQSVALQYVLTHPVVGAGIGQATLAMNEARGETWRVVHNMYLEYGVELGLPGLLMFVLLLAGSLQNVAAARRLALTAGERNLALLADGVQVSLLGFVVAAFFHPGGYNFLFFYIAGLAIALRRVSAERLARRGSDGGV